MASNLWSAFFAWLQRLVGEPARSFFYPLNVSNIPAEGINVRFGNTEVCNITAFNQSSTVTLTLTTRDDRGNSKQYTISPNAPLEVQLAQVASFTVTGTGGSILAYFTWPETIPASTTVINGPVTVGGNVTVLGAQGKALNTDTSGNTLVVPQSSINIFPPPIADTDSISPVSTPTVTDSAFVAVSDATSGSVSLSVTAGEFVGVLIGQAASATASISDSQSNSYTLFTGAVSGYYSSFYYATASATGTLTITITWAAANYATIAAFAAVTTGINVYSGWAYADNTSPGATTTATTTLPNTLAVGLIGHVPNGDISDPTGSGLTWTALLNGSTNYAALFTAENASEQTVAFSATLSETLEWDCLVLALSPSDTAPQTLTISVTAGDAIIVSAEMTTGTISSVTDSQGNSYTLQLAAVGGLNVYNGTATVTGTLTITVNFDGICQELVALDVAVPNGNPTVRINTTSTPLPPIPGTPTLIIAITNTESDLNTNTAILFAENGLYIGLSPTAGTATPVLSAVTKQDVVLSYSGTASTIHAGG